MSCVIKIIAGPGFEPTPYDDKYVKVYVPVAMRPDGEYEDGGALTVCDDPADALRFATPGDALQCYRQEVGLRPDGRPNRPLTSYTVEIQRL